MSKDILIAQQQLTTNTTSPCCSTLMLFFLEKDQRISLSKTSVMPIRTISCLVLIAALLVAGCIDPVEPEFDYEEDIIFINAFALTEVGQSSVDIRRSGFFFGIYGTEFVSDAEVKLLNTETGMEIVFEEIKELYIAPIDFKVEVGEKWKLEIALADGRRFESTKEEVQAGVAIENIKAVYSDEVVFLQTEESFVPGHRVTIDFTDPAGESNYYYWQYKTYETLEVCQGCERGRYRNGRCERINSFLARDYDYLCETDCWRIRYGDAFQILGDRLIDGKTITDRAIAYVPFFQRQNVLVEIQQLALTPSSFEYFNILNDVINESSGLNAPPPAALIGNLVNVNNPDEAVLGQFTATSSSTLTLFIDRSDITVSPIEPSPTFTLEDPLTGIIYVPCEEGRFRTAIKPRGW